MGEVQLSKNDKELWERTEIYKGETSKIGTNIYNFKTIPFGIGEERGFKYYYYNKKPDLGSACVSQTSFRLF